MYCVSDLALDNCILIHRQYTCPTWSKRLWDLCLSASGSTCIMMKNNEITFRVVELESLIQRLRGSRSAGLWAPSLQTQPQGLVFLSKLICASPKSLSERLVVEHTAKKRICFKNRGQSCYPPKSSLPFYNVEWRPDKKEMANVLWKLEPTCESKPKFTRT